MWAVCFQNAPHQQQQMMTGGPTEGGNPSPEQQHTNNGAGGGAGFIFPPLVYNGKSVQSQQNTQQQSNNFGWYHLINRNSVISHSPMTATYGCNRTWRIIEVGMSEFSELSWLCIIVNLST